MQLRHTFCTQICTQPAIISASALKTLLRDDTLVKPLSNIDKELISSIHTGLEALRTKCLVDFPELDDEDWVEIWECSFLQLISARERLIQFKIIHRIYLAPVRFHMIYASVPDCSRCAAASADFIHIFWRCPHIQTFWMAIASSIIAVTTVQVSLKVDVCQLGLVDPLAHHRVSTTLLMGTIVFCQEIYCAQMENPSHSFSWHFGKG